MGVDGESLAMNYNRPFGRLNSNTTACFMLQVIIGL